MATIHDLIVLADHDSALLVAIQELKQYRENPLAKMVPCEMWVRKNNIYDQIEKMLSELAEVDDATSLNEVAREWYDVLQVAVTGMGILKIKYGVDLFRLVEEGQIKNEIRDYNK
jgi:hypothetical protein